MTLKAEAEALGDIAAALEPLDQEAARRVLWFALDVLDARHPTDRGGLLPGAGALAAALRRDAEADQDLGAKSLDWMAAQEKRRLSSAELPAPVAPAEDAEPATEQDDEGGVLLRGADPRPEASHVPPESEPAPEARSLPVRAKQSAGARGRREGPSDPEGSPSHALPQAAEIPEPLVRPRPEALARRREAVEEERLAAGAPSPPVPVPDLKERVIAKLVAESIRGDRAAELTQAAIAEVGKSSGYAAVLAKARALAVGGKSGGRLSGYIDHRPKPSGVQRGPSGGGLSEAVVETIEYLERTGPKSAADLAAWSGLTRAGILLRLQKGISAGRVARLDDGRYAAPKPAEEGASS